jgi:hypothetical protein
MRPSIIHPLLRVGLTLFLDRLGRDIDAVERSCCDNPPVCGLRTGLGTHWSGAHRQRDVSSKVLQALFVWDTWLGHIVERSELKSKTRLDGAGQTTLEMEKM